MQCGLFYHQIQRTHAYLVKVPRSSASRTYIRLVLLAGSGIIIKLVYTRLNDPDAEGRETKRSKGTIAENDLPALVHASKRSNNDVVYINKREASQERQESQQPYDIPSGIHKDR